MVEQKPVHIESLDDEKFVAVFRERWGRPTMTTVQAAAFDAGLAARRHERQPSFRFAPALLGVAVMAVIVSPVWLQRAGSDGAGQSVVSRAEAEPATETEAQADDASFVSSLWHVLDRDVEERLSDDLGGEYQVLGAWMALVEQTETAQD